MNPEPGGNPSNRDIDTKKDDKQFSLLFMGKKVGGHRSAIHGY